MNWLWTSAGLEGDDYRPVRRWITGCLMVVLLTVIGGIAGALAQGGPWL